MVYPGASHNRFEHCMGVCNLAVRFTKNDCFIIISNSELGQDVEENQEASARAWNYSERGETGETCRTLSWYLFIILVTSQYNIHY